MSKYHRHIQNPSNNVKRIYCIQAALKVLIIRKSAV